MLNKVIQYRLSISHWYCTAFCLLKRLGYCRIEEVLLVLKFSAWQRETVKKFYRVGKLIGFNIR